MRQVLAQQAVGVSFDPLPSRSESRTTASRRANASAPRTSSPQDVPTTCIFASTSTRSRFVISESVFPSLPADRQHATAERGSLRADGDSTQLFAHPVADIVQCGLSSCNALRRRHLGDPANMMRRKSLTGDTLPPQEGACLGRTGTSWSTACGFGPPLTRNDALRKHGQMPT